MPKNPFLFPLKQHIGAPSVPVVIKGENVLRGELLARKPENSLGANLFSAVSGAGGKVRHQGLPVGVTPDKFDAMEDDAMKSGNIAVNPRVTTKKDVLMLYQQAL